MVENNQILQKEKEMSLFDKFYEALACGVSVTDLEKECMASIKEAADQIKKEQAAAEQTRRLEKAQDVKSNITEGILELLELYGIFDYYQLDRDHQDMLYTKASELADVLGDLLIKLGPRVSDVDFRGMTSLMEYLLSF